MVYHPECYHHKVNAVMLSRGLEWFGAISAGLALGSLFVLLAQRAPSRSSWAGAIPALSYALLASWFGPVLSGAASMAAAALAAVFLRLALSRV